MVLIRKRFLRSLHFNLVITDFTSHASPVGCPPIILAYNAYYPAKFFDLGKKAFSNPISGPMGGYHLHGLLEAKKMQTNK